MPGISELARDEAEQWCPCGGPPCQVPEGYRCRARPVQPTGPLADAGINEPEPAAPFSRAMRYALAGQPIPRSVLLGLADEGGDFVALTNAITRHRRG